jgi:endoglucanase
MGMGRVLIIFLLSVAAGAMAQQHSKYIVVDQFGYLPGSRKVAVLRDPVVGFDAEESFSPGTWYAVVNATTGESVYRAKPAKWNNGQTDPSSGDMAFQFEFTPVTGTGTYYILDEELGQRSYDFVIAPDVFNQVLKHAMRTFFYQRVGFRKEAPYAGEGWADEASHVGDLQDNNCRSFFDKYNRDTERDVSGGWYDAGDFNKYTGWTASYVVELMKAYLEKPDAWGDDYNIPESGNGMPDILDEAVWGIDHLLRMQQVDGSVLSIVGEAGGSPPSTVTAPSYYGPPNTSATLNTSAAFAIASRVYREAGLAAYADTLLERALLAYEWGTAYPDSLFYNNSSQHGSQGLGAGQQETDDYGRAMARLKAACYLFRETGDAVFRDYFDAHYRETNLYRYNGFAYPFEASTQELLLYYTTIDQGTPSVQDDIRSVYRNAVVNGEYNLAAYLNDRDPYLAYMKDYVWGSNGTKSNQGSMNFNLVSYSLAAGMEEQAREGAEAYIHYLHGVNPLNMVYLSNMYEYGADRGVNEFYHSWFTNGSPLWDRVGTSVYGPAPGFLTGGPNPSYDRDGCCPSGCGSSYNNSLCNSESISPPRGQPAQKSYKDFNTSWPLNSWSVTENSCGYQASYIRLLSKFVTAGIDCNGEEGGAAFMDSCGVCAGGSTGIEPNLDPKKCPGYLPGTAINEPEALKNSISVFPNPNDGLLYLECGLQVPVCVEVLDLGGQLLIKEHYTARAVIDTGALPSGTYILVHTSEDQVIRHKIIMY